jgi:hypothetical protein
MKALSADTLPDYHTKDRIAMDGHMVSTISNFTQTVSHFGEKCGKSKAEFVRGIPKNDPIQVEIADLDIITQCSNDPMKRTVAYKKLVKLRKKLRTKKKNKAIECQLYSCKPLPRPRRRVVVPYFVGVDGAKIADIIGKGTELTNFFRNIWTDSEKKQGEVPSWVWARWNREVLSEFPEICGSLLREIAFKMSKGKTGAADLLVMEMILELDEIVLDELAEMFILRTLNHESEDNESAWDTYTVSLIMKKIAPRAPGMLRPISILPVLSKLYFAVLLHIVKDAVMPISVYQFAFKEKHQAAEVVFILKMMIEKANEWSIPFLFLGWRLATGIR